MEEPKINEFYCHMPLHEVRLSVTGGCNHDCFYCGPFSDGKHSDSKDFRKLTLNQIEEIGSLLDQKNLHIQITGGEPSLRKDLEQIVEILRKKGNSDIGLTTNCSYMSGDILSNLVKRGLKDIHIHVPSFDRGVFERTIRREARDTIDRMYDTTRRAKSLGIRVEFNMPITKINVDSLPEIMSFCYKNGVNCKLIEVVSLEHDRINFLQISDSMKRWLKEEGINPVQRPKDPRWYGEVYDFKEGFFFRIAPTTPFLMDNLKGRKTQTVLDGRYWIGGANENYLFNASYFPVPHIGNIDALKADLEKTIRTYQLTKDEKK